MRPLKLRPSLALILAIVLVLISTGIAHAIFRNNKLSGGNITGGQVLNFKISPDGKMTVFNGDLRNIKTIELFSVPSLGGDRIRLSHNFPEDCDIYEYSISTDSRHVIYYLTTGEHWPNHCGLFAVPIEGGLHTILDEAANGYHLVHLKITGDGSNVLFVKLPDDPFEDRPQILYRVPIQGGSRVPLTDEIEGEITYKLTPDHEHLVLLLDHDSDPAELFLSDMQGVKTPLTVGAIKDFQVTPDGKFIIYKETTTFGDELFSIPVNGGEPEKLNGPLTLGGNVDQFAITPNSNYVVYNGDETVNGMSLLYQAPVDGSSSSIHLLPTLPATPGRNVTAFKVTPNSQGVVFKGDLLMDGRFDLYSVAINGETYYRLNEGMINTGDVNLFEITPNSLGVIILMHYDDPGVYELFAVLIDGSAGVKLNDTLTAGGNVFNFAISPDGNGVVYRADQDDYGIKNLYAVPTTGGTPVKVNPELAIGGDVITTFQITADSRGVMYIADQDEDEVLELFITYDFRTPTEITLSSNLVDENKPVNSVVGNFSTNDLDIGDSFTYTLVPGAGGGDNGSFNISGSELRTSEVFDYNAKHSYSIRVRSTDQGWLSFEKSFTIIVNEVIDTIYIPIVQK